MKLSTVSIYKRVGGAWQKTTFDRAFVRFFDGIGFEKGGRYKKAKMTVRIFSPSALAVSTGDMIECGIGGTQPSAKALTIAEISDNLSSNNAHIRITAV